MVVHRLIVLENIRALRWPGLIGALLLLVSLAFGLAATLPAERERQQTRLRAAQAAGVQARVERGEQLAPATPEGLRAAFYRDFPAQGEITRWIEEIYDAAADEQLSLARGEYILTPIKDTRLNRYQITLPVRGDYGRIRRFIDSVQAAVPNLGLDELSLQRQDINEAQVDARIRLTLYLTNP